MPFIAPALSDRSASKRSRYAPRVPHCLFDPLPKSGAPSTQSRKGEVHHEFKAPLNNSTSWLKAKNRHGFSWKLFPGRRLKSDLFRGSSTLRNWLIILAVGAGLWFCPMPEGLGPDAWHIFAVFVATVLGFILHPMPIGAMAFISLTFCAFTGLLKTSQVLMGFGNGTIWLIVCAFFLSRAFIKTGFGRRIAYVIIRTIGRSSLTLGYSIALSEAFGSEPGPSSRKIGAYLMQVGYHTDATTCMMFLTSMAGNPLCVGLAASAVGVEITWTNWALAAIVPGLVSLAIVPWVVSLLSPPEIRAIPNAREIAMKELSAMGPMSKDEKVLAFVFVMCLVLWATGRASRTSEPPRSPCSPSRSCS